MPWFSKSCCWAPEGFQPAPLEFPLQEVPSPRICISNSSPGDTMMWVLAPGTALGESLTILLTIPKIQDGACLPLCGGGMTLKLVSCGCGLGFP